MAFLSILFALLIEQLRPLRADNAVYAAVKNLAVHMENWFNAGQEAHGRMAWFALMLALMGPTWLVYWVCVEIGPLLALVCNILVAYLTLGFRHYSHYFTSIQLALGSGDETTARTLLSEWTGQDTAGMGVNEISRLAVENALITAHRNVFGVFFWFMIPIGPAGAVMYRVAEYAARAWNGPERKGNTSFGQFAAKAFYWIDWVPARLTAIAFAVVGNFEDAIYAWRNLAPRWSDETTGIILASGSGAMGWRLGTERENAADLVVADAAALEAAGVKAEGPVGEEATTRALHSTVGLVWRALLLWMLLLLLLSFAAWFG